MEHPGTAKSKVCYACAQHLPIDQFRHRTRDADAREGRCRQCYNGYMRAYRRRRRGMAVDRFVAGLRLERSLNRAAALSSAMILRFGGVDRFAGLWASQVHAAAIEKPGSTGVLRACDAIGRLIELAGRQKSDYSTWTDEDLEREFQSLLAGLQGHQVL